MTSAFGTILAAAAGAAIVLAPTSLNARSGHELRAPVASPSFAGPALSPDRGEIAFVSGGDVYTSNGQLLDASSVRLPFIRITDRNGQDMEMHPRPVDVPVERPTGESYTGKDIQLDVAVRELLKVLGRTATEER